MATQNSQILISAKDDTKQAFDSVRANAQALQQSVSEMQTVMRGWLGAEVVQRTVEFARASIDARIEVDKLRAVFTQSVGAGMVASEIRFLRDETNRLGAPFAAAAAAYGQLAAASKQTVLEGQATREIFTAIAEASTVLHLSSSDTEGALRAVSQMMSKGKVSAEELRGQLGERLPGAFQIAARAMGVTTGELDKMLSEGKLFADEFLPRFASQIRKEFAGSIAEASQSAGSQMTRLQNAWTELKQKSSEGIIGKASLMVVNEMTGAIKDLNTEMERSSHYSFWDNLRARSAGNPLGEALFGKAQVEAMADARRRAETDRLRNRFNPEQAKFAADAAQAKALAGQQRLADANSKWSDLSTKFRTAEEKAADLRKEITATGTAAGKSAAEIEKLIAASTPKSPKGPKAGKSDDEKAFDGFLTKLKSEAESAAQAALDLQLEVESFGLGDIGKQQALLDRLRDRQAIFKDMAKGSTKAGDFEAIALQDKRIEQEERRLELMQATADLERRASEYREDQASRDKILSGLKESAVATEREAAALTVENENRGKLRSEIEAETIARLELEAARISGVDSTRDTVRLINEQIVAHRKLREQMQVKEVSDEMDALKRATDNSKSATEQWGLTFASAAEDAIVKWKGFGQVFDGVAQDIARGMVRMNVTTPLLNAMSGKGDAGWVGSLVNWFKGGDTSTTDLGSIGGANGGGSSGGWTSFAAAIAGMFGGGRAGGGFVNAGQIHPVSENGPELLYSGGKSYLLPGSNGGMVQPMAAGGGGMTANVSIQIDARTDSAQVEAMARRGVKQALAEVHAARSRGEL